MIRLVSSGSDTYITVFNHTFPGAGTSATPYTITHNKGKQHLDISVSVSNVGANLWSNISDFHNYPSPLHYWGYDYVATNNNSGTLYLYPNAQIGSGNRDVRLVLFF